MRKLLRPVLCFIFALIMIVPASPSVYAAENEAKVVRVGWFISDLFQEGDNDDEPKSGYAYDYLRKLTDYTSWEYEYVYGDWSDLYERLCKGEIDFMAGMSLTEERKKLMLFPSSPMETDEYYLFKRSDDESINLGDLSSFEGKKIGLLRNNRISDFAEAWLSTNDVSAERIYFETFDDLHAAFSRGEIDLEPRTLDGGSDYAGITAAVALGEEPSYVAVSIQRPDLLKELNEAISCMNSADPYALQKMQYNNYGTVYKGRTLTKDEQSWIEQHSVLRVGYIDNYLPYCARDAEGKATGIMRDVLDAVFRSVETDKIPSIQYLLYDDYQDLVDALHTGEIDLAFPITSNTWHLEQDDISASSEVISDRGVIFYKDSLKGKKSINTIAVEEGNQFQEEYTQLTYPDAEIKTYPTIDACLAAVLAGEVDGTIMDALRTQYVTEQSKYSKLSYIQLEEVTGKSFGIARGNKGLLMLVNRGLKLIGTTYGYDHSYPYLDAFDSYDMLDFVREHVVGIGLALICVVAMIMVLAVLYIRKQRRQLAIQKALKSEAERANAAKSTFLFNMSHDIRTPMNAVLGFNELMLKNIDNPDKIREYIGKIKVSGEYLLRLINNVLEVAKIDSGRESLNEEFADLKDESYLIVFENDIREKKLNFTKNIDIVHRYVYTDAHKIREIMLNLLSNAIKYTPEGGNISISLKERSSDFEGYGDYICEVSDSGIGMTEEFQKHVFDNFTREHNSTESKIMGTGLGMAIVKKLTDLMGGTVTVRSKPGEGSTFTVGMSLRIVDNPEEFLSESIGSEKAENVSFEGKRILLTEDNELNAEIATTLLENSGALVELAKDGIECIDMLQSHEAGYYSLILMDIQMPNLNGYDTAKKIRALSNQSKANIPIVAMTANAFNEDRKKALEAGMNGHIAKPISIDTVAKVLKQIFAES